MYVKSHSFEHYNLDSSVLVRPKILKIMLVDAYNASIILKCLYMPIILKIMLA